MGTVNCLVVVVIGGGLDNGRKTYLEPLTSTPCQTNSLTRRSFPPDDTACNGGTPSRTELTGWPWEKAYLTRPTLPLAAAEWRPKVRDYGVNDCRECKVK